MAQYKVKIVVSSDGDVLTKEKWEKDIGMLYTGQSILSVIKLWNRLYDYISIELCSSCGIFYTRYCNIPCNKCNNCNE